MTATTGAKPSEDLAVVVTRIFDAPRELVFKMFTDPNHLAQFWGPTGFTNTVREMDPRPGAARSALRCAGQTARHIRVRDFIAR